AASQSLEQAPPSPDYVPGLEYPEYLDPSDNEIPDPEEDPTDYPADGGDDDEEEEASEDDEDEESEHLAPANSTTLPAIDLVPSVEETEPFETNEYAATPPPPRSPHNVIPLSQTCLCRARKTIRPQPPMAASTEALDTVDASIRATEGRVMTAIEEVNERMTYLATSHEEGELSPDSMGSFRLELGAGDGARLWRLRSEHYRGMSVCCRGRGSKMGID
ncbi:hypothetical protein Tco_1425770, partial [Tanacetum coccineum]